MTSYSGIRHGGTLIAFVALISSACTAQSIEETQSLVIAEGASCARAADTGVTVNHYHAVLFNFTGFDEDGNDPPCASCIATGRCPVVAQECACMRPHPPTTGFINRNLSGLRFTDVVPGRAYCIALFAVNDTASTTGPDDPSHACDCVAQSPTATIEACGLSPFPGRIEENAGAIFVPLDCGEACPWFMP